MDLALLVTLVAAAALVVVSLAVVLAATVSGRRRLAAELRASRAELSAVQARLDDLARTVAATVGHPRHPDQESGRPGGQYLITSLPDGSSPPVGVATTDPRLPEVPLMTGREFASAAIGESLVRVVSVAHGVRRALSAENRNRIRFEVRREVKRSRRQRRHDLKEAKRQLRGRGSTTDLTEDAA